MTGPLETHKLDQMFAAIRMFAAMLFAHYKALQEEGFTPAEAFDLTLARQTDMSRIDPDPDPEDGE